MCVQLDVCKLDTIKQMYAAVMAKWGKLDILFNNAGWEGPTFCPEPNGFSSISGTNMRPCASVPRCPCASVLHTGLSTAVDPKAYARCTSLDSQMRTVGKARARFFVQPLN